MWISKVTTPMGIAALPALVERRQILGCCSGRCELLHGEAFQNVADFYVAEIRDSDSAFESGAHLADVFLEAPQRANAPGVNHHVVAQDANFRVALHQSILNVRAGDHAHAFDAESVANFGAAQKLFLEHRSEQADHSFFNFVHDFVDDGVQANFDVFLLREISRFALGADVETDNDRVRSRGKQHIGFRNSTDAGLYDFQFDLIVRELRQHFAQHFDGTLHVSLDENRQILNLARFELFVKLIERET